MDSCPNDVDPTLKGAKVKLNHAGSKVINKDEIVGGTQVGIEIPTLRVHSINVQPHRTGPPKSRKTRG